MLRRAVPAAAARRLRRLLGEKLDRHGATVWLVNTGWTGGPYGEGHRMPIQATAALLHAALVRDARRRRLPHRSRLRLRGPRAVPGVQTSLLDPRPTWADPTAYDDKATELAAMFKANFENFGDGELSTT